MDNLIVVTMQRNEGALLSLWVAFYERLAPLANLFVIDNGSDDPATLDILATQEQRGLNVVRSFGAPADFARKGAVVQSVIESAGVAGRFALPCDCDELLYLRTADGPSIEARAIARHFRGLSRVEGAEVFRINEQVYNIPGSGAGYRQLCKKIVLRQRVPAPLDNGYHYYSFAKKTPSYPDIRKSGFGYLHFHNKPFASLVESAHRKLLVSPVVEGKPRESRHVLTYLDMTEDAYLRGFADKPAEVSIADLLAAQGLPPPFTR